MRLGKTVRKALSVLLIAAMLFSSTGVSPVMTAKAAAGNVVTSPADMEAGSVLQFDFYKNGTSPTIPDGFVGVGDTSYTSGSYGWTTGIAGNKGGTIDTTTMAEYWLADEEESALKTACDTYWGGAASAEFKVDVPNGVYDVEIYAQDMGQKWKTETFAVNGEDVDGSTVAFSSNTVAVTGYATSLEQLVLIKEAVTAANNEGLTIAINGTSGSRAYINAMVISCESVDESVSYTIEYDINGGTGTTPADENGTSTETAELSDGSGVTRDGYRLVGWSADADAAEGSFEYNYNENDASNGIVTLYAVWAKEYELVYNSNGGSSDVPTDSGKYIVGEKITLDSATEPTREGYTFVGWAGSADAESAVSTLTVAAANISGGKIQVYAVWQQEGAVSLKFDFGKNAAAGFTQITTQTYTSDLGYGYTNNVSVLNDKTTNMASSQSPTDAAIFEMCKDYSYTTDTTGLAFRIDVAAGTYDVEVYAGLGGTHTPTIAVNGKAIGTAATAKPANESDLLLTTTVTVADGEYIEVTSSGFNGRNMLNGIIVKTAEAAAAFDAPQNVEASSSETGVTISWDEVAEASHYNIFRENKHDDRFLQIGTTTGTSYEDPILTNQTYDYYVVAVKKGEDSVAVSEPSETVTASVASHGSIGTEAPAEEYSDRAMVAVKAEDGVFVSWRLYEEDSDNISFTLKRNGSTVYTGSNTSFMDVAGRAGDTYTLTASEGISAGGESTSAWEQEYQEFELEVPASQTMPNGDVAAYMSNDLSVGDLDGDGELELIVKWYPSNAQDNSNDGYTGTTILDAYDIDVAAGAAELMWRIDLGLNIRSGAHYTQYQVWDYDGDGKAEIICKTADGTTTYNENLAETGHVGAVSMADLDISEAGTPDEYDFRQHTGRLGRIVLGEEYLTAFDGETGEIIDTVNYVPFRGEYNEKTGTYDTSYWGLKNGAPAEKNDGYANRADRFLSATAYLDGGSASAVFCRGYYGRTAITAWKLIDDELVMQWAFDVDSGEEYSAQGNHGLSVNDVDGDGLDEIIYAAMVLNSDGTPRVNTEWGHGDALHVSDWDGDGELEVYKVNEEVYGAGLYDPNTGEIQWFEDGSGDTGRGVAADVDPRYEGAEMWHSIDSHTHDVDGDIIYEAKPSQNFSIFWDGDLLMELLDSNNTTDLALQVQKWNYVDLTTEVLLDETDTMLNNGTKANAGLVADIYGDWREEILVRDANDSSKLRLYSTTCETPYSFPTFLEDRAYREGVAWQNVGYNQPANVTYLLSQGIEPAVITNIDRTTSTETLTWDAADDGAYGMPIEGYEIYRADSAAALWADYELVGTVAGNTLTFTDTGLTANTEYTYIVAAVIGGETSYKSLPESAKTTVAAEGVQPVEPITLVQDDAAYTDKFPATVVVVDTEGNEEIVDITWDYSTLEIETDGEKTVYGAIYGYEELIPVQVTVLKNKITSVEVAEEVYTLVGTEPQLPAAATLKMYNNIDASAAVTWNKTYDISAVGSYEITGTVTSKYGEEKTITLTVHVADDYVVSVAASMPVILDFECDETGLLPATVTATFASDGRTEEVAVAWSDVDTTLLGEVTIDGVVEGYAGYAQLLVKVDYPVVKKFDFGKSDSPETEGWITIPTLQAQASASDLGIQYTAEKGYGFNEADMLMGRYWTSYSKDGFYPGSVYNDIMIASDNKGNSSTFMVDVENGEYIVEMLSSGEDSSTIKVEIEGQAYSVANKAKTYEVGRFEGINVTDGQLTMVFTGNNYSRVAAIIIHKVVEGQDASTEATEKVEAAVDALPDVDSKLTPYDVTRIEAVAQTVANLTDSEKSALSVETIEKLDALYAKANNLTVEIDVTAPAEIEAAKRLTNDSVTAKGAATASAADEGIVSLEIVQQKPTKDVRKAQIEFKASLKVNAQETELQAPIIITIELPEDVELNNLKINHYTDDGDFVGTISKGSKVSSSRYVLDGRKVTFRTNSFSIFTFVADGNDYADADDDYSSSSASSSSSRKPQSLVVSAGKWMQDETGWWYGYLAGGYAANKWEKIDGKWYYFEPSGYMKANGWVNTNGVWYYCKADGAMAEAEWILDNGVWYYLNAGGSMAANGWILYHNLWYYLKSDGAMAANEVTPDGYKVDANGVWVQ